MSVRECIWGVERQIVQSSVLGSRFEDRRTAGIEENTLEGG